MNEVEVLSKKATRGAGYAWGMAEEAGRATKWLCLHGLDGCAALTAMLTQFDQKPGQSLRFGPAAWRGEQGVLCPLSVGVALSDRAQTLPHDGFMIADVAYPILVLPFAAAAARQTAQSITVDTGTALAVTDGERLSVQGRFPVHSVEISVSVGGVMFGQVSLQTRADPKTKDWAKLESLAHRTYAPATEESRQKGAGSDTH